METAQERTVFIVIDPAQEEPIALERAIRSAKFAAEDPSLGEPKLHVFVAVDSDVNDTSAENPAMHRDKNWFFNRIINPLDESGLEYDIELSWSTEWYSSIVNGAKKLAAELIMIPLMTKPKTHERMFNESIWRLLRTAECPVLIVQPSASGERKSILAAVNILTEKPEYERLNEMIIKRGQWSAKNHGADLHVINAYSDSLNYPDRSQLAKTTEVDRANIHVKSGDPEDVISATAHDIGADLVVLGMHKRKSRWRGNTAEKIITKVDCDILTIN